jgi:hypothetical protein
MSPTARTKKLLEAEGFAVAIVERWIPGANIRRDMWGFLDIVAIRAGETLGVQVTTADHVAHRRRKILDAPTLAQVVAAGWRVEIHGWKKVRGRWCARREPIDLATCAARTVTKTDQTIEKETAE